MNLRKLRLFWAIQKQGARVVSFGCHRSVISRPNDMFSPTDLTPLLEGKIRDEEGAQVRGEQGRLQMAIFRAIENGVSMIRATKSGLSGAVEHRM
jgi:hypothetical protein